MHQLKLRAQHALVRSSPVRTARQSRSTRRRPYRGTVQRPVPIAASIHPIDSGTAGTRAVDGHYLLLFHHGLESLFPTQVIGSSALIGGPINFDYCERRLGIPGGKPKPCRTAKQNAPELRFESWDVSRTALPRSLLNYDLTGSGHGWEWPVWATCGNDEGRSQNGCALPSRIGHSAARGYKRD
jgi:hypothetical protein